MTESNQGPATPGTAARCEEVEGALRKLLRWAEMEIDANQHTGHFLPHGYVHDQACRECVGIRARAGLLCGYHNALRVAGLKGEPQANAPTAPSEVVPEIERLKAENASLTAERDSLVLAMPPAAKIARIEAANASLLESLREAEKERDFARGLVGGWHQETIAAEQRAEAAEKEHRLCTGKLIQAAGRIANAEHDLAAAEKRSTDLMPLVQAAERLRDQLEKYNSVEDYDLAFALEAADEVAEARAALHDEERPQPMSAEEVMAAMKTAKFSTRPPLVADEERSAPPPRKHWPDCALNHGGTECDMGPDCGSRRRARRREVTPDQIAEFCGHESRRSAGFDCICGLLERFRSAALRERAARWLAAFDTYITAGTELYCRHCNSILRDAADPTSCDFCRPLRALLEEAGK